MRITTGLGFDDEAHQYNYHWGFSVDNSGWALVEPHYIYGTGVESRWDFWYPT